MREFDVRVAIVVSRFNEKITERLLQGASKELKHQEISDEETAIFWVPGALEIPLIAKKLADSGQFDTIICLGAVIRGETYHFECVANEATSGIARVGHETGVPVMNGVLTTNNIDEALERSGGTKGNKGEDVTKAAFEMVTLLRKIRQRICVSK